MTIRRYINTCVPCLIAELGLQPMRPRDLHKVYFTAHKGKSKLFTCFIACNWQHEV